MKKFEYYAVYLRPDEDIIYVLDEYGDKGWEAFHLMPDGDHLTIYLKREKSCNIETERQTI